MKTPSEFAPLTPAVFHILLSLASGEKHGYEIMKHIKQDTNDKVKMGNGTLYGSIKRMLESKLIVESGGKVVPGDDERRIYYRLTELGRRALNAEMERYAQVVALMRKRNLNPNLSPKKFA